MMPFGSKLHSRGSSSGDGSDSLSSSPGLFITPLRSNRARMLTEETVLVHNGVFNVADAAVEAMRQIQLQDDEEDNGSAVSSLSVDSLRRFAGDNDQPPTAPQTPPQEISIPTPSPSAPPSASKRRNLVPSPPPVWTGLHSPLLPRPRAPKHAAGAANNSKLATFTLATTPTRWKNKAVVHVPPSIAEDQISNPQTPSRDGDESTRATSFSIARSATSSSSDLALLGNRPKRQHRRVASGAYSVGSLVGQSSFVTAPTTPSSSVCDAASTVFLPTPPAANGHRRKKTPVRNEIKYMLGRVASPIRRLTHSQEVKPNLQRAKGCLT